MTTRSVLFCVSDDVMIGHIEVSDVITLACLFRVYIEADGVQSLKLYITDIQPNDAGVYECRGEVEGTPETKSIELELFGESHCC